ncbi:DUF5709 domain-containing protein [Gordonia sp. HY002]|uniref:DUF5709 domain-containing protein n=1 Tax=Gordonia zhenghanii TaxID=2911516 RepID=UPI001EF06D17|nr:DUF5709 domain-containing protein [Gordonia zhenghanii]MCF8569214.1 DUF5709 domain-containing protein [Gordonia zhenghanii]MCF8603554.1 DUF5709 domain-containing protein [Gordonia zhenghanii]
MNDSDEYGDGYAADDSDQLQPEDTLLDEEVGDILDRGYSPPDYEPAGHEHETLDSRLAEEVPDASSGDDDYDPDFPEDDDAGDQRSGRLVSSDEHSNVFGVDAGVDGAGASAEEAAIHIRE